MKIFLGGGRGGDTFKMPSPYEQLLSLPTPCFKFLKRSLNNPPPPPHFKRLSLLAPPHPLLLPPSQKILIIHKTNLFRLCKSRVAKSLKTNMFNFTKADGKQLEDKSCSTLLKFNFTKVDGKRLEDKSCSTLQKSSSKKLEDKSCSTLQKSSSKKLEDKSCSTLQKSMAKTLKKTKYIQL